MGYLDNSSVTIDAILTLKGRELLAKGTDEFKITQFALGDDEVDYTLWNTDHPLGSAYYGTIIDNMPILEAVPDETQALKYKLITLPKDSKQIPVITVASKALTLRFGTGASKIVPTTANAGALVNPNANYGYTAILSDTTVATLSVAKSAPLASEASAVSFAGDRADATTFSVTGLEFNIEAKQFTDADKTATVTIIANETGGSVTVNLTIKKYTI